MTGVAGFIGSHLAEILISSGYQVLGIDDLSGGVLANIPPKVSFENRSVVEPLDAVFQKFRPAVVFHLAAYAAEGLSHHIPLFNYNNNVLGTVNVLSAAYRANCRHFVFTSSIAAYGHSTDGRPFDESTPCHPVDPYGAAKLACEHHIRGFQDYYGGPTYTIFRPHNVFGSRQNISDPYRNVVGIFMSRVVQGKALPIFGDGLQTRNFSHISGVAEAIALAPRTERARNLTVNIGGDEVMSVLELARAISTEMKAEPQFEFLPARKEVRQAECRHEVAHQVFPSISARALGIRAGLREMADYVRSRPLPVPTECPTPIEISDQLPPSWSQRLIGRRET